MSDAGVARARSFAVELDVLRGVAALLMIANHAGYRLLAPDFAIDPAGAAMVFVGSFAPVVFFFATGFGIALSTARALRPTPLWPVLWKASLLVLADQFFYWRGDVSWGMDFFGFIALSSVAVTLIARSPKPEAFCVALMCALVVVRYGFGSVLRAHTQPGGWSSWLSGVHGTQNLSYPLAPWLVFPLLGFVLGRQYDRLLETSPARLNRWLAHGAGLAAGLLVVAAWLASRDLPFFRWGIVSGAYFELALGVVLAACLFAVMLVRVLPALSGPMALRGVASFAVIPIHYALLDAYSTAFATPVPFWGYVLLFVAIAAFAFRASSWFAAWVSVPAFTNSAAASPVLLAGVGAAASALWFAAPGPWATATIVLAAQLAVAALLGCRVGKPRAEAPASARARVRA